MFCRKLNPLLNMFLLLMLIAGLSALFLTDLDNLSNYQGDESLWVTVSHKLFVLYAIEHQFDDPAWQKEYSTFGSRQPQIGKYLIGFGTSFVDFAGEPEPYSWRWNQTWQWNMDHTIPPPALVLSGRLPIALMGVLTCLAFYWLVTLFTNKYWALAALASLLGAQLLIISSRVAMIDTPALGFSLMTLIGMFYVLRALRSERASKAIVWALPTGLAAGLAVGTKLNALLMLFVCGCSLLGEALLWVRTSRQRASISLICLALIVGSVVIIFYVSNPFLYRNPVAGAQHLLEMNDLVASIQFDQLKTIPERVTAVWNSLELYGPLHSLHISGDRWLTLFGALALAATVWQSFPQLRSCQLDLIIVWIGMTYVGITLWIPHDWFRYYLPLQTCNAFLQAYGLYWLGTMVMRLATPAKGYESGTSGRM
jgi:hypothetical protein